MRNLLITLAFDGTNYHGFQVQRNAVSVCGVFQDAVERLFGQRLDVKGCSRTDAGVHARMYCLSMKCDSSIPCDKVLLALNRYLPRDIAVTGCREVGESFHARYRCAGKQYVYDIHNARVRDPFDHRLCHRWGHPLDAGLLDAEAGAFVGTHDFAAFQGGGGELEDTVRTITSFRGLRGGGHGLFWVEGDGFLNHMVRIMVGTLCYIGLGRISQGEVPAILASKDRTRAGKTMPAQGLCLHRVLYDDWR